MNDKRHRYRSGEATATFEELSFREQALSINGQIASLRASIRAHLKRASKEGRDVEELRTKRAAQVEQLRRKIQEGR